MTKSSISAIVLTRESEGVIEDCLKSLTWVNQIVVVDSGSKDKTIKIAEKYGAKFVISKEDGFSEKRNKGAEEVTEEWLLYIDSDERVTPQLRNEISKLISNFQFPISNVVAYAIPRKNIILGREMKHGGWWPDYVKRLFLKSKFKRWKGELHEEPQFEGELGHLESPLVHLKHDNLSDMVDKTNEWSEIEARLMYKAGHPNMNVARFLSAMTREFWLRMVKYRAFLDGAEGIMYAFYQVYSRFISYAKLWEKQLQAKSSKLKA